MTDLRRNETNELGSFPLEEIYTSFDRIENELVVIGRVGWKKLAYFANDVGSFRPAERTEILVLNRER